jgi:hypothetical protein
VLERISFRIRVRIDLVP